MPPFRIHQTRSKPERILIKITKGQFVLSSQLAAINPVPAVATPQLTPEVKEKKKEKVISLKQIKQMVLLLQQTQQKNISKMLSPELASLLSIDEHVNPDQVPDEDDEPIEALTDDEEEENDEDILVIDV